MKSIKTFVAVAALSMMSFGAFAQSVSATGSTLDGAEAKIAAQAAQQGAPFRPSADNSRPFGPLQGPFLCPPVSQIYHNVSLRAPLRRAHSVLRLKTTKTTAYLTKTRHERTG